jgi:3'-5' exoribonuclease
MKRHYVNELAQGTKVDAPFALRSKEMRAARTGEAYLSLELADRTGRIPAVCFRPSREAALAPVGCVVQVHGTVTAFRGVKRVSIDSLGPASRWDAEDMIASGVRSRSELVDEFKELVGSVKEAGLRRVLAAVFGDRVFFERFSACPGSQSYHHAYLGGLLEHSISVAGLCRLIGEQYSQVDSDLLLTAALLHDIGKCKELAFDTTIEYTDEGRLVGHVVLGVRVLREALTRAKVHAEAERLMLLEHAVLSHHGELEWGSPKRPSTLEALLLHHADNLDAKAAGFSALLVGAVRADEGWTDSGNLFRRPLWAPRAAEDDRPYAQVEDIPHGQRTA